MTINILVTGSAGFIGRNFTNLYSKYYNLFHIDALQSESDIEFWETLPRENKRHMNVSEVVPELLEHWKITHVLHLAARSHVDDSIANPIQFTEDNIVATHKLLEACRKYGKLKAFVQVSTDEVLGSLGPDDHPFREDDNYAPNSPYSASKAGQELIARAYHETYKLPVIITRCSNNYGKWQHPSKLIPKAIKCLLNDEKIPVYGVGLNIRDWIDVENHCYGLMGVLLNGKEGETYHFGGNCELTNRWLIETICRQFGKEFADCVEFVDDRLGHDHRYAVNSYKAQKEFGWRPDTDIHFGLSIMELVRWAKENSEWLNRS